MRINPYLTFNGDCAEAFKFYEDAAGGKIETMATFGGSPAAAQTPPDWHKKIIHGRVRIGDVLVMGSDAPPGRYEKPQGFSLSLRAATPADAERFFAALSRGGEVRVPLAESFFATRFGMLVDKFGIPWMVLCEKVG